MMARLEGVREVGLKPPEGNPMTVAGGRIFGYEGAPQG